MEKEFLFLKKMSYLLVQCRNCATEILLWKFAYVHEIEDIEKAAMAPTDFSPFIIQALNYMRS
jgi:hypothetical protein